ncbi:MAG: hypothetical protein JWR75_1641 [Devosia sp.]|nr:hypothetical protein [Devosia sp.]
MTKTRIIIGELVLALLVLALMFLNFGHGGADLRAGANIAYDLASLDGSLCGDTADLPADHAQNPCHACRVGADAALPSAPACATPAEFGSVTVAYAAFAPLPTRVAQSDHAEPRAPPAA